MIIVFWNWSAFGEEKDKLKKTLLYYDDFIKN